MTYQSNFHCNGLHVKTRTAFLMKQLIRDIPIKSIPELVAAMNQPKFRSKQLQQWLCGKGALEWDQMSNIPASLRNKLADKFALSGLSIAEQQLSSDGTRKFLFMLRDEQTIESVIIPMDKHYTFCVSSQVGCAMGCSFCATSRGGLVRNLTSAEIVEQVIHLQKHISDDKPKSWNIVFMGMGEPLDNWDNVAAAIETFVDEQGFDISPRRITISTSGHIAGLKKMQRSEYGVGLTVSVNSCDDSVRKKLMPVPGRTPLPEILDAAEEYSKRLFGGITIAYVLLAGINDSKSDARVLASLVRDRPFKVNLIPLNAINDKQKKPQEDQILQFQKALASYGVRSFIRSSSGEDIDAACGQLRNKHK
jgi:23S rRNA (adenine2503-C2)-methyltransferase